jgi:hypothetical protein
MCSFFGYLRFGRINPRAVFCAVRTVPVSAPICCEQPAAASRIAHIGREANSELPYYPSDPSDDKTTWRHR